MSCSQSLPLWVSCNACAAELQVDTRDLKITNCGHMFCEQCIPKEKCLICQKMITDAYSITDKMHKTNSRMYFQDPSHLMEILEFQICQMVIALKNAKTPPKVNRCTQGSNDAETERLKREIASLKEENRYWQGLFNSSYTASTPKIPPAKLLTPSTASPQSRSHLSSSSCSSTEGSPLKHGQFRSKWKDSRKLVLLQKDIETLREDKWKLQEEFKQAKGDCEESKCRESILLQQVAAVNTQMKTMQCEIEAYQSKCGMLQEESVILNALLGEGKDNLTKSDAELGRLRQSEEKLSIDAQRMKAELEDNNTQLQELKKVMESLEANTKVELDDKNIELYQLTSIVESLNAKVEDTKREAQKEINRMTSLLEQKTREMQTLECSKAIIIAPSPSMNQRDKLATTSHHSRSSGMLTGGGSSACSLSQSYQTPKQQTRIATATPYRNVRITPFKKLIE